MGALARQEKHLKYDFSTIENIQSIQKNGGDALGKLLPDYSINFYQPARSKITIITCHCWFLPLLFPQHGVGKKHDRDISLTKWQSDIVEKYPHEFIRASFQSDGCIFTRVISKKYNYKSYSFSNKSKNIIDILEKCLNIVGINSKPYFNSKLDTYAYQNFKRKDVKILEEIIPIKN